MTGKAGNLVVALACVWLSVGAGVAKGRPVLNEIPVIRDLSPEDAAEGLPVRIEAQVLRINPLDNNLFLFDGKAGIYVEGPSDLSQVQMLRAGDWVRVDGMTTAGGYAPDIHAANIQVIGHEPRPEARQIQYNELLSTSIDCDWKLIRGRLISAVVSYHRRTIMLQVSRNRDLLVAQLPYTERNMQQMTQMLFNYVEFNAVAGTVFNRNRQATGRIFYVNSADDFSVVGLKNQMNVEVDAKIHELMRYNQNHRRLTRTRGVVTCAGARELYLRGERACLKVIVPGPADVKAGDEVTVEGIVWPQPVSPAFRARTVRVTGSRDIPVPIRVNPDKTIDPTLNYDLIEIDAELIERGKLFIGIADIPQQTLRCRSGGQLFEVRLPAGNDLADKLAPGARLRLTGICNLLSSTEHRWYLDVEGFWLQVRGAEDIEVLEAAPWWTARRLVWGLVLLFGTSLLFVVWVVLLRRTVGRQTWIIREQVGRETVLNERQRIARELHDTLEQGLTALSVQLKNIRRGFGINAASGMSSVDLAEKMLRVCREESRASIVDLRGGILETMNLPAAIRHTLDLLVKERPVHLHCETSGTPVPLNSFAERHLLRMITEAANNGLKHAGARNLFVTLSYAAARLELSVRDDGCGFDAQSIVPQGRLGICGMHERANRLHGKLTIQSVPGEGTRISFSMPTDEFLRETE